MVTLESDISFLSDASGLKFTQVMVSTLQNLIGSD